ncbi:MAG TPA: NAD-binding protein, partial [Candidatus Baltobacteraceae bacterium]|nr:NAD-binding protein [Candidatus Baltobacteraceae bacterium]
KMATDLWYVGERADKAASLKILGNAMIIVLVAGLSDVFAIARNLNMKPTEAFELFNHFKPGNVLEYRGKTMAAGDFTAAFELTMARKDLRLNLEAAQGGDVELTVLPAIAERMDTLIQQGHGGEDLGVLAIDAVRERVAG